MRIEEEQMWSYFEWLIFKLGLVHGAGIAVGLSILGFLLCFIVSTFKYGPGEGFFRVTRVIYELLARDLPGTSMNRVFALSRLAFQEAIRRKVLALMAVFIVVLLFAGWFLDSNSTNIGQLYISFVMTGTSYLVLLLGLFLSCFSLPADITSKTIQTITTKPVRATEIVLGRIFGFGAVGTVLLVAMGVLSYFFVVRGVNHSHSYRDWEPGKEGVAGATAVDAYHSHKFTMEEGEDGSIQYGVTNDVHAHKHTVTAREVDGETKLEFGAPEGLLQARMPIYGSMAIYDRAGNLARSGLNVGYESEYQTYIEGASLMSAVWTFDVDKDEFPEGKLPIELSLKAFRTFKGDIVTGVQGEIILRNPNGSAESRRIPFIVKEFEVDQIVFDSKMPGSKNGEPQGIDIFDDLVSDDGKLEIMIRCTDPGQYFGMAVGDVYLRAGERQFGWNLFKGFLGIWMQMVLVICLGVMFSTFLSGPVAMIATLTSLVLGFFGTIAADVATGETPGGGPIEAIIRMPMQTGALVDLDLGNPALETAIEFADAGIMYSLYTVFQALPAFGKFNTAEFVAYGFNIFPDLVGKHLTMTFCYFILTSCVGYFFLKTRELAAA